MSEDWHSRDIEFTPPTDDEDSSSTPSVGRGSNNRWLFPAIAVGCGCVCLPLFAIFLGVVGLGSSLRQLYQSTGTHQVYELAAEKVEEDSAVANALGAPVEAGWTFKSRETYGENGGQVCLRFNVDGRDRAGSAYAEAQRNQGTWQLHQLTITVNGIAEPLKVMPLSAERSPLCPNFDESDSNEESDEPAEEILPGTGVEI